MSSNSTSWARTAGRGVPIINDVLVETPVAVADRAALLAWPLGRRPAPELGP